MFWKLERADLIDAIRNVLVDSSSSSDEECSASEEPVYRDILQRYTHHLRCKYVSEIPNTTQWPPSPTRKVFNLAMIHRMPIQQVPVSDDHIRQAQMGKVDDIMLGKTGIALEGIFNPQHKRDVEEHTIVLIEGAPGAGKSTLAWHICKSWGSGSLFGEFTLVVYSNFETQRLGRLHLSLTSSLAWLMASREKFCPSLRLETGKVYCLFLMGGMSMLRA